MTSVSPGPATSAVEVREVVPDGFWLRVHSDLVFLPFEQFPWFQDVPLVKLTQVQLPSVHHLYWPELDIDLAVESIFHPERFPLVSHA